MIYGLSVWTLALFQLNIILSRVSRPQMQLPLHLQLVREWQIAQVAAAAAAVALQLPHEELYSLLSSTGI